ncbi:MAG: hypothetical protein K6L81_18065 [Agarilytica sp.]
MKNKVLNYSLAMILLGLLSPSYAGQGIAADNVDYVAFNTGGLFLYADGWQLAADICDGGNHTGAVVLRSDDHNYDKAYALVLSAFMAGKKISGYTNGCVVHDGENYVGIRGFKYLRVYQ